MTLDYRELKKEFLKKQRKEVESWKKTTVLEESSDLTEEEKLTKIKKQEHWEYLMGK